ncbi:MAG: 23S rRNA (pseudouridine(1915)-N(3))-methyltransferase RlmH [Bacteroidota bacterium]|nr:23S rRNA (pseudouridine(1915)-N(3))-methyltransferase RlmH [Chitinophagaceae bacterium]QLH44520.1 MAG: 23S rRNA (pseudouridine(1915)-N(3))-methyltransferase RlmH [Bacteroidota bacterium]
MLIELWSLGKDNMRDFEPGITEYAKRINRYHKFNLVVIDNSKINKAIPLAKIQEKEMELIVQRMQERDLLVCLDENGTNYTSVQFAEQLNTWFNRAPQRLIFVIGGSYGISKQLLHQSVATVSLSKFTFPHQLVRLVFTEQLYRAFSILNNEKYHHD